MQSKAMEMLDNLDKNPATGMGKKVSTVHTLYILVLSFCRGVGSGYRVRARHSSNPLLFSYVPTYHRTCVALVKCHHRHLAWGNA